MKCIGARLDGLAPNYSRASNSASRVLERPSFAPGPVLSTRKKPDNQFSKGTLSAENLVDMLQEIETADPIASITPTCRLATRELRRLLVGSLVERHQFIRKDLNVDDVRTMYLLSTAKLLV